MTSRGARVRGLLAHGIALAILLWPLVGIEFVPMVDLPGHLAITRVLDDYLHGQYHDSLRLNPDPVYKPTYVLLYGLFLLLPKSMVGPCAAAFLVAAIYAAVCYAVATLADRPASSPLVVSLAILIAMFSYGSAFFWGLIPFLLAAPPALVAYASYLRASGVVGVVRETAPRFETHAFIFLAAALAAHAVHPLASFFLAIMLAPAALVAAGLAVAARAEPTMGRLGPVAGPLVVWAPAVLLLHRLGATSRNELDLQHSMSAALLPFHGLAAARAFLAQIPIELGLLPTRDPSSTFVSYPVGVATFLVAACVIAFAASRIARTSDEARGSAASLAHDPAFRLGLVLVASALLFLFARHDLVRVSMGALWYPVRGPAFVVFFFGALAAALLLRLLERGGSTRWVAIPVVVCALGLTVDRSAVLGVHFARFDQQVAGFFRSEVTERWLRSQPLGYNDHIRTYNCFFDAVCRDHHALFFSIYPNATIYPLSLAHVPPDAERGARGAP